MRADDVVVKVGVQCAGGGSPRRAVVAPAPCGWKGRRGGKGYGPSGRVVDLDKSCPRCGGKAELVPADGGDLKQKVQ